jgi:ribosomal protein S11
VRQARIGNGAGHSPHGAGGLVLGQHAAAVFADDAAAQHSVGAHAGEHHGQHARAVDRGHGAETAHRRRGGSGFQAGPGSGAAWAARRCARSGEHTSMCQLPRRCRWFRRAPDRPRRPRAPATAAAVEPLGKEPVNSSGMCCTISTGSGKLAGSAGSRISRAAGPPVETPMASTTGADEMGWALGGGAGERSSGGMRPRGSRRERPAAAGRTGEVSA